MKVLALYNIKGGVGKTAAAVNLAYLSASCGARTLVWDLDPQGAASYYFRVKAKLKGGSEALLERKHGVERRIKATDYPNLDLLPADFSHRNLDLVFDDRAKRKQQLRNLLQPLAGEYDYVFLDCAPSISLVSENVFRASDALLIPTIPTTLSLRTLKQLQGFLGDSRYADLQVFPFFSMVDRRKRLHRDIMEGLPQRSEGVFRSFIPYASDVERMGLQRAVVEAFSPRGAAAHAFRLLWLEIQKNL
ncbi:MAG: ParA family protein [Gammaproteobacteria bacterium]|nr:ParA family protein [Gammaproteobacteria bacterium]